MTMLTDRDQFAMAALTALKGMLEHGYSFEVTVESAYRIADAMLKERAKTDPQPVTK